MNPIMRSVAIFVSITIIGTSLSGCIGSRPLDDNDPYVRISTYYDPDLTRSIDQEEATFRYGLFQGSPANVGKWNSVMVTLGSDSDPDSDLDSEQDSEQDDALPPPCPSRSPGDTLEFPDPVGYTTYCVELDAEGKTYFSLVSDDAVVMEFKVQGRLERHEDCPWPGYRMGGQQDQIPGKTLVHGNEDIVVHFGVRC